MTNEPVNPLGPYRLAEQLATSGLGEVFRAEDTRGGRQVALTIVRAELAADPQWREQLFAAAQRPLPEDEHIQQVYEAGEAEGRCYVAAEPFARTLRDLIAEWHAATGVAFLAQGLALAAQAASALQLAHEAGIVHGQISSPLLRVAGPPGEDLKLGELGLAGLAPDQSANGALYRSPEQCRGEPPVPQSDIYALGVVLYEMIGNRFPFTGPDAEAIAQQHITKRPPPPRTSDRQIRELVLRCLEKEPQLRYATAGEVAAALDAIVLRLAPPPVSPDDPAAPAEPPQLPPPPPPARTPQVEVLDAAGQQVLVQPLTGNGLRVAMRAGGRDPIVVAPEAENAQFEVNVDRLQPRSRAMIAALDRLQPVFLGGAPVAPGQNALWESSALLQVGSHWLRLVPAQPAPAAIAIPPAVPAPQVGAVTPVAPSAPPATLPAAAPAAPPEKRWPITITIETAKRLELIPDGSTRTIKVKVKNVGDQDASFYLQLGRDNFGPWVKDTSLRMVQGWFKVDLPEEEIVLGPGAEKTIPAKVTVTRRPAHRAGDYGVRIGTSPSELSKAAPMVWSVAPYLSSALRPDPRIVPGVLKGVCTLYLDNRSNVDAAYEISGSDPERVLRIPERQVQVPSGQSRKLTVPVRRQGAFKRARLLGEQQYALTFNTVAHVEEEGTRLDAHDLKEELPPEQATFIHKPIIPPALIALLMALLFLVALALVLFFLLYPRPQFIDIATNPTAVVPQTAIALQMQVSNADRVQVLVPPLTPITVTLNAPNAVVTVVLPPNFTPPPAAQVSAYGGPGSLDIFQSQDRVPISVISPTATLKPTSMPTIAPTLTATPCLEPALAEQGIFSLEPKAIIRGEAAMLNWSGVKYAIKVSITNVDIVDVTGSQRVSPSETTTYILTATDCDGDVFALGEPQTLEVIDPPELIGPTSEPPPLPTITPQPTPAGILSCPPRTRIRLTGTSSERNAPFFVYFDKRVVGGGSTNADGSFETNLIVEQEYADEYPIKLRLRSDGRELRVSTYQVDAAPVTSLSPAEAAQLTCVVPKPTPRPSATAPSRP